MPRALSLMVAQETQTWIDLLYERGAVSFDAKGKVKINPKLRKLVAQMHETLAAGDKAKKTEMEKAFDKAVAASSALGAKMGPGVMVI